ncbi:MAG: Bug family tripartite tricarboxylate transporter substrate binding protein [Bacteroidota bacterium]
MKTRKIMLFLLGTVLLVGTIGTGWAKTSKASKFPTKPIQVIVPMAPGGASDLTARAMEKLAKKYLGQSLVIVNKTGASGVIGYNELVNSRKDGYTLGLSAANMLLQPLYGITPNDYGKLTEPICQAVYNPIAVSVLENSPFKTIDDVIKYAQENPGKIKYAYSNVGSLPHILSGIFVKETKVKMEPVPFATGSESTIAFLGGNVQLLFSSLVEIKSHAKDGKVRILAVSSTKRLPDLPDIPTLKECKIDVEASAWFGICAPAGIPKDVKAKLAEGFKKIVADPEFEKTVENLGFYVEYLGPEESAKKWDNEVKVFAKAIEESGIGDEMKRQAGKK